MTTYDSIVIAAIAALPPTIAALASLLQGRKIITKTAEIHELTNSNLTAVKADLAQANAKIKELQSLVASLVKPKD